MKLAACAFALIFGSLEASVLIIDDFSFSESRYTNSGDGGGTPREVMDASVFGEYRRSNANGFVTWRFVDGMIVPGAGDSSGTSYVEVVGGILNLSKTALTGFAGVSYGGRPFTPGDNIGDLSLDISGGSLSLASPILFIEHAANTTDQIVSLFLASAEDTYSSYEVFLRSETTRTVMDLESSVALVGVLGPADFANIEQIGVSLANGDPAGSVQFDSFGFIPEPKSALLISLGAWVALSQRITGRTRRRS